MQVRSGGPTGAADLGNRLSAGYRLSFRNQQLAAMSVKGALAAAVVDDDVLTITSAYRKGGVGFHNSTGICRYNGGAMQLLPVMSIPVWKSVPLKRQP